MGPHLGSRGIVPVWNHRRSPTSSEIIYKILDITKEYLTAPQFDITFSNSFTNNHWSIRWCRGHESRDAGWWQRLQFWNIKSFQAVPCKPIMRHLALLSTITKCVSGCPKNYIIKNIKVMIYYIFIVWNIHYITISLSAITAAARNSGMHGRVHSMQSTHNLGHYSTIFMTKKIGGNVGGTILSFLLKWGGMECPPLASGWESFSHPICNVSQHTCYNNKEKHDFTTLHLKQLLMAQ